MSETLEEVDASCPCDAVGCKNLAEYYLPINDVAETISFHLCASCWTKVDDGQTMELIRPDTGEFYRLNFQPIDDTMEAET